MGAVAVCILIHGNRNYFRAGREAARSVLEQTDFDLFLALGPGPRLHFKDRSRVFHHALPQEAGLSYRARPFLRKFHALQSCLEKFDHPWLILMDADTLIVQPVTEQMVVEAMAGRGLGMVEQETIRGSGMGKSDFLEHYVRHSLVWIAPESTPPDPDGFRFHNSGVVLGKREQLGRFLHWALATLNAKGGNHVVGRHMITDQDYYQVWTNNLHPESTVSLPWYWNHCEHWDEDFPRKGARILHFSNFCRGPTLWQVLRMNLLRRGKVDPRRIKSLVVPRK
jgi:hypothetical protein